MMPYMLWLLFMKVDKWLFRRIQKVFHIAECAVPYLACRFV